MNLFNVVSEINNSLLMMFAYAIHRFETAGTVVCSLHGPHKSFCMKLVVISPRMINVAMGWKSLSALLKFL